MGKDVSMIGPMTTPKKQKNAIFSIVTKEGNDVRLFCATENHEATRRDEKIPSQIPNQRSED